MISLKFRHRSDRLDGGPYLWKGIESPMATTTYAAADRGGTISAGMRGRPSCEDAAIAVTGRARIGRTAVLGAAGARKEAEAVDATRSRSRISL